MMRHLRRWISWTLIFSATIAFGLAWLGAVWAPADGWIVPAEIGIEVGLLALALTLWMAREESMAPARA